MGVFQLYQLLWMNPFLALGGPGTCKYFNFYCILNKKHFCWQTVLTLIGCHNLGCPNFVYTSYICPQNWFPKCIGRKTSLTSAPSDPLAFNKNRPFSHCLCACVYRSRGALFLDNRRDFTEMRQTDFKPLILSM